ncbi:MAG: hypothetical protein LBC63_05610, partial [Holophagales bacterium]|nr:hypothetical protein [Holophagales bacterium]
QGRIDINSLSKVRKLLQEEGLADLGINPVNLLQGETAESVRKHFGLAANVTWAVVNSNEQCLASGQALPAALELAETLASKGVRSPVRILRDFLKTRPDHLDARLELLKLQRRDADRRTKDALGLNKEDSAGQQAPVMALSQGSAPSGGGTFTMSIRMPQSGQGSSPPNVASLFGSNPKPAPIPKDKVLDNMEDLQIWAGFAESFDRLLTGDDWIAAGLEFDLGESATELCSPSVKTLFKRKIAQVEAALERAPTSDKIWSVWIRMADVVGGKSIISVADRLVLQPGADMTSLPKFVREKVLEEARDTGNWPYIAENLWSQYEAEKANPIPTPTVDVQSSDDRMRDIIAQIVERDWTQRWDSLYEPLLEALLYMNDIGRADSIMNTMREWLTKGQWSVNQMQKAIGLANRCNKPDVAKRWTDLIAEYVGK